MPGASPTGASPPGPAAPTSAPADRAGTPLLATRGLTKSFRGLTALKGHAISVWPGEIVGVIGPNGSGKSTFFNLVTGFQRADSGAVELDGKAIHARPAASIARLGIARTFQGSRLFTQLSVLENLQAAAQLRHPTNVVEAILGSGRLRRATRAVDTAASELLGLIGLAAAAGRRAGDLPYGDQRRLELARALATGPRLLMLDEPAAGMDHTETKALLDLILEIRRRYGVAVIVVEHDMDLIMNLCERIQVLAHGEVIFEGPPAAVRASPRVREVYLGGG
jgi:branched-chain amino acid transport system ATP-binding protein